MKKMKFSNCELFRSSYGLLCCNKDLRKKNSSYLLARKDIHNRTDYLEMIRLNRNFKIIQYLLLNENQRICFPFISNPDKFEKGYEHSNKEYAQIFNPNFDLKGNIWKIKDHYDKIQSKQQLSKLDMKLWEIIHPKVKSLFDHIDA